MEVSKDVSVVIVNFNAGPGLVECVRSIVADVLEVIVVDNSSSDGSISLLWEAFAHESRLRVVQNTANHGFAKACNSGAEIAIGRFILYLNPDCEVEPNAIRRLRDVVENDEQVGMAGGLLLNPDGSEQAGGRRAIPTPWRSLVRVLGLGRLFARWPRLFGDFYLHKDPLPKESIEIEAISGACMLVRREAIAKVGPLDEGYFMHCEDLDWCMRFRQNGWKILFVPDARIMHRRAVSSQSRPIFVEWCKHKGMIRFYCKFFRHQYPGVLMWLVTFAVWLRFSLLVAYLVVKRTAEGLRFGVR